MIEKVIDAVVEAEGLPIKAGTWVHIDEVPDGGWGAGGQAWTLADLSARLRAGSAGRSGHAPVE